MYPLADSEIDLAKRIKCLIDDRYDLLRVCDIEDRDTKAISIPLFEIVPRAFEP
jgi:hypothetical protein